MGPRPRFGPGPGPLAPTPPTHPTGRAQGPGLGPEPMQDMPDI